MAQEEFYPAALTIAASDSGGGSGVQADLRTFNAAGVYGCSVITAVAAQNPRRVLAIQPLSAQIIREQLIAVLDAVALKVVKTGMLVNRDIVHSAAEVLKKRRLPLIVDLTVFSAKDDEEVLAAVKDELLLQSSMAVLNIPECEWFLQKKISGNDYAAGAAMFAEHFKCNCVLVISGTEAITVIDQKIYKLAVPAVADLAEYADHGAGCTFSAGIAAMIAYGNSWKDAVRAAGAHVFGALNETAHIGRELDAMYPPLEDYSRQVSMKAINSGDGRKGRR